MHIAVASYLGIGRKGNGAPAGQGDDKQTATEHDASQQLGAPRSFRFPIPIQGVQP